MRALIIDNEKNIIEGLMSLIDIYCPDISRVDFATTITDATDKIAQLNPDVVFLDVELDEGTGMDLIQSLENPSFQLIFITAYDHYAVEAFKHEAIDYLLKPIDPDDLVDALSRAVKKIKLNSDQNRLHDLVSHLGQINGPNQNLIVNDKDSIHAVEIGTILYLKADGPYTWIKTCDESLYISKNLKYFESLLIAAGFYRAHHSYLVNLKYMKRFDKGSSELELRNGMKVPVSMRKKDGLLHQIKSHT